MKKYTTIEELLGIDDDETMNPQQKVLHSPFDVNTHKATFINYLEVMIDKNGKIHYAIPSHSEWCIAQCMNQFNMTRDQVFDKMFCVDDMCKELECVAVWNGWYVGNLNEAQTESSTMLAHEGLYQGEI